MFEVVNLPKVTKTQQKRLLRDIIGKAGKLCNATNTAMGQDLPMSAKDFMAIQSICTKLLNKLK